MVDYKQTNWWTYLDEPMKDLVGESFSLLEMSYAQGSMSNLHDYSFVVFPLAKAYEGFLKKLFLDMGLISRAQYFGEHFRIGKALNPNLPKRYRSGWVYGKLVAACGGRDELPNKMWAVWKSARNRIFHFFPDHKEFIDLDTAAGLVNEVAGVMGEAMEGCKISFG